MTNATTLEIADINEVKLTKMAKINRGHLRRAALKGLLYIRCNYHYTDDYAYDNDVNFGHQNVFTRVYYRPQFKGSKADYIATLHYNDPQVQEISELHQEEYRQFREYHNTQAAGRHIVDDDDFRDASVGRAWVDNRTGEYKWSIHSNLMYTCLIHEPSDELPLHIGGLAADQKQAYEASAAKMGGVYTYVVTDKRPHKFTMDGITVEGDTFRSLLYKAMEAFPDRWQHRDLIFAD